MRKKTGATRHPRSKPRQPDNAGVRPVEALAAEKRPGAVPTRAIAARGAKSLMKTSELGAGRVAPRRSQPVPNPSPATIRRGRPAPTVISGSQQQKIEERIAADLECGLHAELIPEVSLLVSRYPLRERLRAQLILALQTIVLAARASGIAAIDGVFNGLEDPDGLKEESLQGRSFGFDGKSVIHPAQIAIVNACFSPSEAEIANASRLIEAASGGAERFEGRMIEDMHVMQARAILAKART